MLSYSVSSIEEAALIYCVQFDQVLCFREELFTYRFKFYAWTCKPCTNKGGFNCKISPPKPGIGDA